MEKLIIIGAGGYAKVVMDSVDLYNYRMYGFLDEYSDKTVHMGYPVVAHSLDDLPDKEKYVYFIAVGDNHHRSIWYNRLMKQHLRLINVIDKSAIISPMAVIGNGCFVGRYAIINSNSCVGNNCIINNRASVEHGCSLANHVNMSTNAVINGDVHVGEGAFIGSASVTLGQKYIGCWSVIGAGAVVTKNVKDNVVVAGVPANILTKVSKKMMKRIYIVAEIGCNHNGSVDLAKQMISIAKECGVDAVKFQMFKANLLISSIAPKAEYQKETTGNEDTQLEMTQKLELSQNEYIILRDYALSLGLDVFSTPFDMESLEFLYKSGQIIWKIPSGEITNLPYLKRIGSIDIADKQVILSTGMATMEEIKTALNILIKSGTDEHQITLLHCNTEYPTPDCDVNLSAIEDLKQNFPNCKIGYSDHSVGSIAAIGAVSMGISMIEKHFTLDKNMPGPDHKASADPEEMKRICNDIRRTEVMLGFGKKIVTESEIKNKIVARKSIVAKKNIKMGELFTEENIICKRPGNGISPMYWYKVLGQVAEKDFKEDSLIEISGIKMQECEI